MTEFRAIEGIDPYEGLSTWTVYSYEDGYRNDQIGPPLYERAHAEDFAVALNKLRLFSVEQEEDIRDEAWNLGYDEGYEVAKQDAIRALRRLESGD